MGLTEKTTHEAESVALLVGQFKEMTLIEGLVGIQAEQAQEEETALFEVLDILDIASQVGTQLDGIGKIVGEDRKGKADAVYRIYLRARILANLSSGTGPELITIAIMVVGTGDDMTYREYYPAAFKFRIDDAFPDDVDIDAVVEILQDARSGGVKGFLEYTETDDDYTFTFADADAIQTDGAKGFAGDQTNDEMVTNWDFDTWVADDPFSWNPTGETGATKEISEVASGNGHGGGGVDACNFFSSIAGDLSIGQSVAVTAGYRYQIRLNISLATSGQLNVTSTTGDFTEVGYTTTGEKVINFTATGASAGFQINNNSADIDLTLDDFSVIPLGGVWADVEEI